MSGKFQQSISEAISVLVLCVEAIILEPRLGHRHCSVKVGKSAKLLFSNEADCQLSEGFTKNLSKSFDISKVFQFVILTEFSRVRSRVLKMSMRTFL